MAAATQLGMSASPFLCPTSITLKKVEATSSQSACRSFATPTTLIICQQDNTERKAADVSRRLFAVAAASATVLGVFVQPEAQAKRKPPPQEEKKKVEPEEKNLSAFDARILANARRKEAMKATVEAAKAKAKSIAPAIAPSIASPE
ncbi:hypothetical protein M758_11G152200 [Ceratodon purpureus]|uniref:Uncharacterized protein n=1 Tax=Ceratodon purpureus TaxID=3225 RepID=A0A8T0GHK8_CERPU|nr:hypothetical protein KC19_11G156300 [Ceratodon purpureus]KAG0601975.1 hypothetical protein M758_11G152200 [Ceratodon purpureus]KAG0601976.1 hypothetical protein M758_11G152200 [Ceratodon purpureus]KAG0601977.1 hypothetical protein M758_11G152200 [Ceratodon purpureus]